MTDDYAPDAAILRAIVSDGLALGASGFIADIEAPSPGMDTPRLHHLRPPRVPDALHPAAPHGGLTIAEQHRCHSDCRGPCDTRAFRRDWSDHALCSTFAVPPNDTQYAGQMADPSAADCP